MQFLRGLCRDVQMDLRYNQEVVSLSSTESGNPVLHLKSGDTIEGDLVGVAAEVEAVVNNGPRSLVQMGSTASRGPSSRHFPDERIRQTPTNPTRTH